MTVPNLTNVAGDPLLEMTVPHYSDATVNRVSPKGDSEATAEG